jgi:ATPase subunit of ABC transporter with duplicated ATPase domains
MSLHLTQIRLSFGGDEVLSDVSAIVRPRDRVALVGRNGAGKTSLLRIIAGELEPEGGIM